MTFSIQRKSGEDVGQYHDLFCTKGLQLRFSDIKAVLLLRASADGPADPSGGRALEETSQSLARAWPTD